MAPTNKSRFYHWFPAGMRFEGLFSEVTAGVLIAVSEVIFAISFGSLIFSGELSSHLSTGIGLVLVSTAILMIVVSLFSKIPGVIATAQDAPVVILALMAAALVAALSAAGDQLLITTVLVAIAVTSLLTGIFLLVLGYFNLGGLARFLPYPVMGGFLAGTGWLLFQGSFGVMAGFTLNIENIPELLQPGQIILWLPGVVFGVLLLLGLRKIRHFLVMPGMLVGGMLVFALILMLTGISGTEATSRGLLLGNVADGMSWQPIGLESLRGADWNVILGQSGNIAIILVLSVIGLLLNASALELTVGKDIDLNREIRAAGVANILSGLAGGMGGYQTLSASSLSYRIGSRGRLAGLLAGVICIVILFTGQSWLYYFPKMILGGVLVLLGIDFLYEWVIVGYKRLSKADYGIVILILVVIASTNFLIGVVVGLVATVILFVLNYSKIEIVYHALLGTEIRSNVERSTQQREVLKRSGTQIYILELQGYIFFGTANALLERLRAEVRQAKDPPVRFVILDFRRVSGLDASAVFSFVKCKQLVETQGIEILLTHVSEKIQEQLNQGGLLRMEESMHLFIDLDRGLEWCEDQLLLSESANAIAVPRTLPERLVDGGFHKGEVERLLGYLEREEFKQGDHLIQQGEEAEDLLFLEKGKLSIYLELENDQLVRLQTLGTRTIVGEMGLYLGERRTASVVAEEPSVVYRLTKRALEKMQKNDPKLSAAFHLYIARLLAERVADTTRLLAAMSR